MNNHSYKIWLIAGMLLTLIPAAGAMIIGGDEGWIVVHCNTDGAAVYLDGSYKGIISGGELSISVFTTGTPYTGFSVSKSGYTPDPYTGSLPRMPGKGERVDVYATLNPVPVPRYGTISATSLPSGAAIYLNGNYRGVTPLTITGLPADTYSLEADLYGYRTYTNPVTVYADQVTTVHCPLQKIETQGSLYISSNPSGAMVYLDSGYKGKTPLSLSGIAAGDHSVELDLSGYYDWKSTVTVPTGGTRSLNANLVPVPSSTTGWISVTSIPSGATVFIDGSSAGQTGTDGMLRIDHVRKGDHTLRIEKSGYQHFSTTTNVQANTVTDVSATLVPESVPIITGTLAVSSTPSGASVFVDNALRGVTPLTLTDVQAGSHQVMIRLGGYQDYTITQQVNTGATNTIMATLIPAATPQATRSGSAPVMAFVVVVLAGIFLLWSKQ